MSEDRAQEALDHLQSAALELIAAARAVLDVAEEAVREPHALRDLVARTARAAAEAASAATASVASDVAGHDARGTGAHGVEHIRVS